MIACFACHYPHYLTHNTQYTNLRTWYGKFLLSIVGTLQVCIIAFTRSTERSQMIRLIGLSSWFISHRKLSRPTLRYSDIRTSQGA